MTDIPAGAFSPLGLVDRAALAHLKSKKLQTGYSHYDVWLDQHAYAFTVAKMMDEDMLAEVRTAIADALENGTGFDVFKKRLKPYLMSRGWWGEAVMVDPLDEEPKLVQLGSTRRLLTIFQTNVATARAQSKWQRIQFNRKSLPYLRYNASHAHHRRDSHKRYYGLVLPATHPIWQQIFPPNGYGCRCSVSQLTRRQAEKAGISPEPEIEYVEVENPRTGETVRVPRDVDPSFAHNHAARTQNVLDNAAQKHGREFADRLSADTQDYIRQRVSRPLFDGLRDKPNLTALSDNVDNAQQLVYAHAGTGEQIGPLPVGLSGSMEYIHRGDAHYLLRYGPDGVRLERVTLGSLDKLKQAQMRLLVEETVSPDDLEKFGKLVDDAVFELADFADADPADKMAAFLYSTNGGYRKTNPALIAAKGDLSKIKDGRTIQTIRALDAFLDKAPKYTGTTVRRMQSVNMPDSRAFLGAHAEGALVRYSNFTSTSTAGNVFGGDIQLKIHGKSGVSISELSAYPNESEVLMPRHAVYRVSKKYEKEGVTHIELQEIDEADYNGSNIVQLSLMRGDRT